MGFLWSLVLRPLSIPPHPGCLPIVLQLSLGRSFLHFVTSSFSFRNKSPYFTNLELLTFLETSWTNAHYKRREKVKNSTNKQRVHVCCGREPRNITSKRQMSRSWVLFRYVVPSWKAATEALRNHKIYQLISGVKYSCDPTVWSVKCLSSHHGARFTFQKKERWKQCHAKDIGIF